jgi:signal peptidase II
MGQSYRGLLWGLALIAFLGDQSTKYGVFYALADGNHEARRAIFPGAFELLVQFTGERDRGDGALSRLRSMSGDEMPRVNHGALFGMASERGYLANNVFAGISLLAAVAIIFWSTRQSLAQDLLLCTALGLILGGTLGNLFDRMIFNGVRDFLHWFYAFEWPVFNIADCCLVVGAFLLLAQALWHRPATEPQTAAAPAELAQTP